MENLFLGINFGHDAGITILKDQDIFTILSERVNYKKQSAEINHTIFDKILKDSNSKHSQIENIAITSTQARGIPFSLDGLFIPHDATSFLNAYEGRDGALYNFSICTLSDPPA